MCHEQGTFLKESIGRELEAMGSHEALNQASEKASHTMQLMHVLYRFHQKGTKALFLLYHRRHAPLPITCNSITQLNNLLMCENYDDGRRVPQCLMLQREEFPLGVLR